MVVDHLGAHGVEPGSWRSGLIGLPPGLLLAPLRPTRPWESLGFKAMPSLKTRAENA